MHKKGKLLNSNDLDFFFFLRIKIIGKRLHAFLGTQLFTKSFLMFFSL